MMDSVPEFRPDQIALFVDLENLVNIASSLGMPVDMQPVLERLAQYGRVTVRRSFGDLVASCRRNQPINSIRQMLQYHSVQIEDIPYTGAKNSSDICLVVDALSFAYSHPDIRYFAILAEDRDYRPLMNKLRELGKITLGIGGSRSSTNPMYVRACDVFIYYESLFTAAASPTTTAFHNALPSEDVSALLNEYCQLLQDAMIALEQRGTRRLGTNIVPQMRAMKSDYDLSMVNMRSFRELATLAEKRGLVKISASGGDVALELAQGGAPEEAAQRSAPSYDPSDLETMAYQYREAIGRILKCELLLVEPREQVYEQVRQILETMAQRSEEERITLIDLSKQVASALDLNQPSVYKMLWALFRQRCFTVEPSEHPFNPTLISAAVDPSGWDNAFIRNTMRGLHQDSPGLPFVPAALSQVVDRSQEDLEAILQEIGIDWFSPSLTVSS
jgi:uncharacterized LabA/DUF88 family protein